MGEIEQGIGCIIAPDLKHGESVKLGHYCIIEPGCVLGDNVTLGNYVLLRAKTHVGDNTFLDSYVKSSGQNMIGASVIVRFNATIARGVTVEDGVFISPNVMTIFSTHEGEAMSGTVIGRGSHIGTNAVIGPAVKIAPLTVVGALAYVNRDITEPGHVWVGCPARSKGPLSAASMDAKLLYLEELLGR